jgi:peptide/nickel transport system permease protein
MLSYLVRRLILAIGLLLVVSLVAFALIFLAGDPAIRIAGEGASAADADRIRTSLGFDRPIIIQYLAWLVSILHGDFGRSLYFDQPVFGILWQRLEVTLALGAAAILFTICLAVPLGVAAGWHRNGWVDRLALIVAVVGQAMPTFWFSLLLVILLGIEFPILPTSGSETWRHFVMPTIVLGYSSAPAVMRLTRSGIIAALDQDYIRTARAMGIPDRTVVLKYALRNALIPVVSVSAAQFGYMLAGSVVVESVFAINGAGRLAWESILRSDLPTVQALILCFSALYVVLTLSADVAKACLDPRIRLGGVVGG